MPPFRTIPRRAEAAGTGVPSAPAQLVAEVVELVGMAFLPRQPTGGTVVMAGRTARPVRRPRAGQPLGTGAAAPEAQLSQRRAARAASAAAAAVAANSSAAGRVASPVAAVGPGSRAQALEWAGCSGATEVQHQIVTAVAAVVVVLGSAAPSSFARAPSGSATRASTPTAPTAVTAALGAGKTEPRARARAARSSSWPAQPSRPTV